MESETSKLRDAESRVVVTGGRGSGRWGDVGGWGTEFRHAGWMRSGVPENTWLTVLYRILDVGQESRF